MGQTFGQYFSEIEATEVRNLLLQARDTFKPYFTDLSEEDKKGRTMAEGREGVVRLISQIALVHETSLARNDDPNDLAGKVAKDALLEGLRQQLLHLLEMVSETQMANGMEAMRMSDRFVKVLQAGRSNNAGLDLAMREVDEWNKRFVNTGSKEESTPANNPEPEA
jgi:hypothetical protein